MQKHTYDRSAISYLITSPGYSLIDPMYGNMPKNFTLSICNWSFFFQSIFFIQAMAPVVAVLLMHMTAEVSFHWILRYFEVHYSTDKHLFSVKVVQFP